MDPEVAGSTPVTHPIHFSLNNQSSTRQPFSAFELPLKNERVIVRVEDNATAAKLMEAAGALSNDGKSFSVVVTREDGAQQTHDLCYRDLLKALSEIG